MKGYKNISQLVTLQGVHNKDGRSLTAEDLDVISNAALIYDSDTILWTGSTDKIPSEYENIDWSDGYGLTMTPEIVDSHTHLVFGGDRSKEYVMRLNGADYVDIANAGGGILSTMKATNEESLEELFNKACERVEKIASYGVGTIEIKSGYSLNFDREKEITLLIDRLKKHFNPRIQIINTFMAAHAVPKTYKASSEYIKEICIPLLEDLATMNVIDFVDIFHEQGYFSSEDVRALFAVASKNKIKTKMHADEFNDNKGALLATELGSTSCDHLLATEQDGIIALKRNKTVATLLPGTGLFLGKKQAQARKLLDQGVKVALASDYNPGSCHCDNLVLIASIAAPNLKMNIAETWSAITYNAAHALDLTEQGALVPGLRPRFSIFKASSLDEIMYRWGHNLARPQ